MKKYLSVFLAFLPPAIMLVGTLALLTVNAPYLEDTRCILGYMTEPFPDRLIHLFDFNNEHRLVTTRLVTELDYLLLGSIDLRVLCAIGAAFLAGWALLLSWSSFHTVYGTLISASFFYLAFAFVNFENLCWAVGGLSNFQTLFWGLCANLLLSKSQRFPYFLGAILCASLATVSNGGGLAIWPCLILQLSFMRLTTSTETKSFGIKLSSLLAVSFLAVFFYLHGMPESPEKYANMSITQRLYSTITFSIMFLGGWVPVKPLSIVLGVTTLTGIFAILWKIRQVRNTAVLFHLVYLLGILAAAAISRADNVDVALSSRYAIFNIGILACTIFLLSEIYAQTTGHTRMLYLSSAFLTLSILYAAATLYIGAPQYRVRNEIMRRNIMLYPEDTRGIRCWDHEREEYDKILRKCTEKGIYNPLSNLKQEESKPVQFTEWLR